MEATSCIGGEVERRSEEADARWRAGVLGGRCCGGTGVLTQGAARRKDRLVDSQGWSSHPQGAVPSCRRASSLPLLLRRLANPSLPPQKFMEKLPYYRDTISQFPWVRFLPAPSPAELTRNSQGRIEKDGSTSYDLILARHSLLGASVDEFGYWASPSGISPHDFTRSSVGVAKGYDRHGAILLKALPDEVEGWKLASELCPRLLFDDECEPPTMPGATVVDWKSWYDWRRIKLESPVALLMDYPLSVYWLLIKVLDVVPLATLGAAPTERRSLLIHYIGAEQELNFLPMCVAPRFHAHSLLTPPRSFSELSLLIPNTDITIVFYGAAVRSLVLHARKSAPRSPAALPTTYSYRAPKSVGESTFTAKLFAEDDDWKHPGALLPDAIVGMNAGLVSDPGWQPVLIYATGSVPLPLDPPLSLTPLQAEHPLRHNGIRGLSLDIVRSFLPIVLAESRARTLVNHPETDVSCLFPRNGESRDQPVPSTGTAGDGDADDAERL